MKLLTGFTYYNGIKNIDIYAAVQQSEGTNSFNFPLNVQDYGEEPFLVGGKYGLHFVASGDVSENMIDFRVESGSIQGGIVFTGNGLILSVIYTKMNDLSCARINQLAWNAAVTKWGANAKTNFGQLNTMYFNGFEGGFKLKPYYRGTEDVIEEIYEPLLVAQDNGQYDGYTYCTSTNIGIQLGEPMYMKKPIIINAQESFPLFTETSSVIETNSYPDSIQIIPLFKKSIHRIINTPDELRFQEIFGVNSIYAIMDRLTSKYTQHIQIPSTKKISIKIYESNDLLYHIDSKIIITHGDSLPSYASTFEGYLFDNNILNPNVVSCLFPNSGQLILDGYSWCAPTLVEYVHVHLFDEDEIILNSNSNYTDIYLIPPTCVFDFPSAELGNTLNMDNIINLSHRTNGLICNIVYNRFRNTLYNSNCFSYLFTYTDFTNISNDDNLYFVLSCLDNDIPQMKDNMYYAITCKENFGIISDNFIVIDGIPRGCNETHYLSGTMFMKESRDVNSTTFHLYIGVRRLSKNILDKVTHYNDYSFTRYINNYNTMGNNVNGYDSNLGKIMMTSEYTIFLNQRSYKTPTLADYGTERKYFDTSVMMNNLKDTSTQLLTLEESERMEYICYPEDYMHFLYGRGTRDNEISGIAYQVTSAQNRIFINGDQVLTTNEMYDDYKNFLKNSTVLTVKIDNKIYEEGTYNIRFMTYPTFLSEIYTSVRNIKGCFIDEKDKKTVLGIQLSDSEFNTIVSAIANGEAFNISLPKRIGLNQTRSIFTCYFNGVCPFESLMAVNEIIITNQEKALPLNVYNNVVNFDVSSNIYDPFFLLTEQDINFPLPTVDTAYHRKTIDIHPMCQLIFIDDIFIGTIKVSSKMLLNPINLLYYIDMSVRVQIKPSLLRSYKFSQTLYDNFSVTVGMDHITSNTTYYPLRKDYWNTHLFGGDPQVKCYIDNGILITNFRIYEQVTCPFNFSSLMKVEVKVAFGKTYINNSHISAFSFNLLDTMWHKNKERNETSFLYIPSYSDYDRITTSEYATYMSGATRNYSEYPFDNPNAGLVMKRCSTSTSVENFNYHAKIKASSRVKECIDNTNQNYVVFTTIQTFGATSLRSTLYPMFISVNNLTGDTVSGAVGIYPSKITGDVKTGVTYLSRTLFFSRGGQYSVLTGTTLDPLQSGTTEYKPHLTSDLLETVTQSIINSAGSGIYLGTRFNFIGRTTTTRYCVLKYASIDNLPMYGLNNIDF